MYRYVSLSTNQKFEKYKQEHKQNKVYKGEHSELSNDYIKLKIVT